MFSILQVAKICIGRLKTVSTTIGVNTIEIMSYLNWTIVVAFCFFFWLSVQTGCKQIRSLAWSETMRSQHLWLWPQHCSSTQQRDPRNCPCSQNLLWATSNETHLGLSNEIGLLLPCECRHWLDNDLWVWMVGICWYCWPYRESW